MQICELETPVWRKLHTAIWIISGNCYAFVCFHSSQTFYPIDKTFSWHYKMFWINAFASERQTMFELDSSIRFQLCRIRVHPDFINKDIRYKIINDVFISSEVFAFNDFVL